MYQPTPSESLHDDVKGSFSIGLMSAERMRWYDLACLADLGHLKLPAREIKRIRSSRKLSQKEFAECLHVGLNTVKKWESGNAKPKGSVLMLLDLILNERIRLNVPCCRERWQDKPCSIDHGRMAIYMKLHGQEPPCCHQSISLADRTKTNPKPGNGKHRRQPDSVKGRFQTGNAAKTRLQLNTVKVNKLEAVCLPPVRALQPAEIKAIRTRNQVDIFLFACCLKVDDSTVRRWERGQCKPRGPALRLLNLIDNEGIDFLIAHKNPAAPPLANNDY